MAERSTDDIRKEYKAQIPIFEEVERTAKAAIQKALDKSEIEVHGEVVSRVKQIDSFIKKVSRRQFSEAPWRVGDIVGLRVLVLFRPDIKKVGELIRSCFEFVKEKDKTNEKDANDFSYLGTHYIVTLDPDGVGKEDDNLCKEIEIQVRTLAMDVWDTISRRLDYKQDIDIPKELKRDFHALQGLFWVADTHFQIISDGREEAKKQLESGSVDVDSQPINLDSLTVFLSQTFPDRERSHSGMVSLIVRELERVGITVIEQLSAIVDRAADEFKDYEDEFRATIGLGNDFQDGDVIRHMLVLSCNEYRRNVLTGGLPKDFIGLLDKHRIDK